MDKQITVKTPFTIQDFESINSFILHVIPDFDKYLKEQIALGIHQSSLVRLVYSKLQSNFKLFILQNYSKEIVDYLKIEARNADKEIMKQVLRSTISINLNINDTTGNKLADNDYLNSIKYIVSRIA